MEVQILNVFDEVGTEGPLSVKSETLSQISSPRVTLKGVV